MFVEDLVINFLVKFFISVLWKNFDIEKNIRGFLENLFECYFLNIIANAYFFSELNIVVCTTLKYCYKQAFNKKLKLMGGTMKYFLKNYWAMKYLALWSPGLQIVFEKICKTLRSPSHILNARSLKIKHLVLDKDHDNHPLCSF